MLGSSPDVSEEEKTMYLNCRLSKAWRVQWLVDASNVGCRRSKAVHTGVGEPGGEHSPSGQPRNNSPSSRACILEKFTLASSRVTPPTGPSPRTCLPKATLFLPSRGSRVPCLKDPQASLCGLYGSFAWAER